MLVSLCLIAGGIAMIVYTKQVVDFTGKFDFAERWFLSGGTYTFVKLFGLGLAILSFMWITGGLNLILAPLAPLFPQG